MTLCGLLCGLTQSLRVDFAKYALTGSNVWA
jgi:hypothetical protein